MNTRYVKAYHSFIRNLGTLGLSPTEAMVLISLQSYAEPTNYAWPSIQTVANNLGLSFATVQRVLQALIAKELIASEKVTNEYGGINTVYNITEFVNRLTKLIDGEEVSFGTRKKRVQKRVNSKYRPLSAVVAESASEQAEKPKAPKTKPHLVIVPNSTHIVDRVVNELLSRHVPENRILPYLDLIASLRDQAPAGQSPDRIVEKIVDTVWSNLHERKSG